jgi:hypothetical protein
MWRGRERRRAAEISRRANGTMIEIGAAMAHVPFCPALAARDGCDPTAVSPMMRKHAEASHAAEEAR